MGYLCDFCGEQRSMVYCRSDAACLCLSCDRNVHSANILSKRHSRTLLCERCNSQPAIVRCWEERVSLCQNCDWVGHGTTTITSSSSSQHKRQTISCYSGCPSAAELSSIWSFVLDANRGASGGGGESACEQEMGLMSINENDNTQSEEDGLNDVPCKGNNATIWPTSSSSVPEPQAIAQPPPQSTNPTLPKLSFGITKAEGVCGNEELYADLDMDEVDLNFENYEELFGMALHNSEELFENGGIDSLFGTTDMSGADSNCQGGGAEGSAGVLKAMAGCSNAASGDSAMSTKTEPIVCCFTRQAHGVSGDTAPEDSGVSSMLLMAGDPPWCPPNQDNSLQFANRNDAVLRYKEKKKMRKFEKRVRYASRKARADVRKRVKGRFVKAGDAYDYDPLTQTRSY